MTDEEFEKLKHDEDKAILKMSEVLDKKIKRNTKST